MPDSHSKASRELYNLRREVRDGVSRGAKRPLEPSEIDWRKQKITELEPQLTTPTGRPCARTSPQHPAPTPQAPTQKVAARRPRVIKTEPAAPEPAAPEPEAPEPEAPEPEAAPTRPQPAAPTELHCSPLELERLEFDFSAFNPTVDVPKFPPWFLFHKVQQMESGRAKCLQLKSELRRLDACKAEYDSTRAQLLWRQQQSDALAGKLLMIPGVDQCDPPDPPRLELPPAARPFGKSCIAFEPI